MIPAVISFLFKLVATGEASNSIENKGYVGLGKPYPDTTNHFDPELKYNWRNRWGE